MHARSMRMMKGFRDKYLADMKGCSVLDVGSRCVDPVARTYRQLFAEYEYTGMDIVAGDNVDIVGYQNLPGNYDVVVSGQVMEHVAWPWAWLFALALLFRRYICIIAPNRFKEHRQPIDCYRFLPDGMEALFDYAGITPIEIRAEGGDTIGIGK